MNVWLLVAVWVGVSIPVALGVGAIARAGSNGRQVRPAGVVATRRPAGTH